MNRIYFFIKIFFISILTFVTDLYKKIIYRNIDTKNDTKELSINREDLRQKYIEKYQDKYDNEKKINRQIESFDKMSKIDTTFDGYKPETRCLDRIKEGDTCIVSFMDKTVEAKIYLSRPGETNRLEYREISRLIAKELVIGSDDIFGRPIDIFMDGNVKKHIYACAIMVNGITFNNAVINDDSSQNYIVLSNSDIKYFEYYSNKNPTKFS